MSIPDVRASAVKTPLANARELSLMGPVITPIATAEMTGHQFSANTGTIAPGVCVPLHAHPEAEMTYVLEGRLDVLAYRDGEPHWLTLGPGESAVITPGARHALRNGGDVACRVIVVAAASMGEFFEQIGRPVLPGKPPPQPDAEWIASFTQASDARGYWLGSPEENAAIGIEP